MQMPISGNGVQRPSVLSVKDSSAPKKNNAFISMEKIWKVAVPVKTMRALANAFKSISQSMTKANPKFSNPIKPEISNFLKVDQASSTNSQKIETTPKRIGSLKAETIGHMDTFRSQYNPEISTEEMVGFIQRGAELFQRIQSGTAPEHSSFHDVLSVSWFTTTSAMDNGQKVFEGSFRFADENRKVDAFLKGFQNNEARFGAGLPKSSTEPYQRFSTHYNETSVSGETLWGSDKQMGIESYETRAMFPGGMNCLLWNQIQSPGSDKKEIFIKFEEKGLPYPGTNNLDKLFSNPKVISS